MKINCLNRPCGTNRHHRYFSNVVDQSAIRSAFSLRRALLSEKSIDQLECESLLMSMVTSVNKALLPSNKFAKRGRWMTAHRLKIIDDLIEERLDKQSTLSELASEMEISAGFFSREFKHATGRSPYQYILDKRLARAGQKLLQSKQDISTIALDCGFTSHAHMTSQFREKSDTTPGQLRGNA